MAANPLHRAAPKKRCDVRRDTVLAPRDEAAEVMRCLRESLREPAFASTLVRLVSGEGLGQKREIAGRSQFGASGTNGKGR
jgi:hypothetical protein